MVKPYQLAVAGMCSYHQWLGGIEEWDHICVHKGTIIMDRKHTYGELKYT